MKQQKTKTATGLLILLITLGSCRSTTTYRPSVYGHDYITREIIKPKTYERISTGDKEFNKYVSFSLDDLNKLRLILKDAKLSKKVRIIIEKFDNEVEAYKKLQALE